MYLQHLIRDHCIQEDKFWDECEITYCYFRVSRRKWEIDNYFSLSKNQADSSENSWDREFQFCCGLKPIGVIFDKDINIPTTTYTCIWAHYWQPHNKESEIKKRLLKYDLSADGHHHGHHLIHNYDTKHSGTIQGTTWYTTTKGSIVEAYLAAAPLWLMHCFHLMTFWWSLPRLQMYIW